MKLKQHLRGGGSIFDNIEPTDQILAFFPCTRFEAQVLLNFRGENAGFKSWTDEMKLEYDIKLHKELNELYLLITKMVIVCYKKELPIIIENPYSTQHYLQRYWCLKPKIIDYDRRERGDYYEKPTQYWFINCDPKNNFIFEPQVIMPKKKVSEENKVNRSMISKEYANRFIREFIL